MSRLTEVKKWIVCILVAALIGCSKKFPVTSISIHAPEKDREAVVQLVEEYAETAGLVKVEDYETLDPSRDAFMYTYRLEPDGIAILFHGIVSDGSLRLEFYDIASAEIRNRFFANFLPRIREVSTSVEIYGQVILEQSD